MKLLKTIIQIVNEAEDIYVKAASQTTDAKELEILENNLDESLRLFQIYDEIKKED